MAQAWYRLLRTIGDPVDLCRPAVVSQTQAFLQYAIASPNVIDPCQHPCLQSLPQIFLKAIKGIAGQVDAFLGKSREAVDPNGIQTLNSSSQPRRLRAVTCRLSLRTKAILNTYIFQIS